MKKRTMTKARYQDILHRMAVEFAAPYDDREDSDELEDQACYVLELCVKLLAHVPEDKFLETYYAGIK